MATSMVDGRYCIALPTSAKTEQYTVRQLPAEGWTTTFPQGNDPVHQITVAPGAIVGNINFANYNPVTKLCGIKYHDVNGNGVHDPGEPPLAGWTFTVTDGAGAVAGSATTGDDGRFCIEVKPGSYTVSEGAQTGWSITQPATGSYSVTVAQGTQVQTLRFGNTKVTSKLCGIKFNDIDGDGIQDPGEVGLPGWTIEVQLPSGATVSTVTGANGRYCLELPVGQAGGGTNYTVSEVMQSGWQQTFPAAPGTYTLSIPQGTSKDGINFGNRKAEPAANACVGKRPSFTQAISYTLSTNKLAVATCYADGVNDLYVMGVMDVSGHGSAPLHPAEYMPPMYHHPDWTRAKLGDIFGLTLDNAGNIYVTATSAYWNDVYGSGGSGAVYKIDGITGNVTTFATLPNDATTTPALGNITFDPATNRFYVSNLEDGLIYELSNTGTTLNTYNHGTTGRSSATLAPIADDGTPGFTQLGRRIWGLEVHNGRLYYAVWWENFNNASATEANEIWSIPLSSFTTGPAQLELTMPVYSGNYSNPVADISFSPTGAMLLAERGIYNDTGSIAHQARVLEFVLSGPVWVASANTFQIGDISPNANSAGGVDYDYAPGGWVWATGDALRFMTPAPPPEIGVVYGLQGLPPTSGTIANSTITDLNGFYWQDKNEIGDVEIACPDPAAQHPDLTLSKSHLAPLVFGQSGAYSLTVTNVGSGPTVGPIIVTDQLPAGITYSSVSGAGWSCVAGPVLPGGQTVTCAHAGPIPVGGSLTLQINVAVGTPNDFPNGPQVKNCADVDAEGDLDPLNDDDCDETTVTEELKPPDLTVAKVHMGEFVYGQSGAYSLTVTNVGSGPTVGPITVTDQLPPGITYASASGAGWSCVAGPVLPGGQTVTCSHAGPIPPGGNLVLVINVNVGPASAFPSDVDVIKNCATVDTQGDPNAQNNRGCDETIVHGKQCIQPPSGMVAWWPLDETSGIIANDIANVNDGTHTKWPGTDNRQGGRRLDL
ncbi:MAG: SdrD B-like domain-containing protein [Caldilineaceae bacterium]